MRCGVEIVCGVGTADADEFGIGVANGTEFGIGVANGTEFGIGVANGCEEELLALRLGFCWLGERFHSKYGMPIGE